jgi:radical SAM protein with 4Fe4S-binding SPASM domain
MIFNPILTAPVLIRPFISSRKMGKSLCVINLTRREVWTWKGGHYLWSSILRGATIAEIISDIIKKTDRPEEQIRKEVTQFLRELWIRNIIDLDGVKSASDSQRITLLDGLPANANSSSMLAKTAMENQVLFRCWLDLLIPCNLRCRHCYLDFSETDVLRFKEVTNYLDQLQNEGCPELHLTGGEIFARRDILEIIDYAIREKGFLTDLLTNGILINERTANAMAHLPINKVRLSLYGVTASTHERVTRKIGTFEKTINAARLLIERKVPVNFSFFVQNDNVEDAYAVREFADEIGATVTFDTKLIPNRNGSKELLKYGIRLDQMAELYRKGIIERKLNLKCTAAIGKIRITARGDVFPCQLINTICMGNLRKHTLGQILEPGRREKLYHDIVNYKPVRCGGCSHVKACEPCAAMRGINQEDHINEPISEACFLTTAGLLAESKEIVNSTLLMNVAGTCSLTGEQGSIQSKASALTEVMKDRMK